MTSDVLAPRDPLAPAQTFPRLSGLVQRLVVYEPATLWEQDTSTLPRVLRRYRRRVRAFADRVLRPRAEAGDLDPHGRAVSEVLVEAGKAGFLSDLLPWPWGSLSLGLLRYPVQLVHSLKAEELCAADAGLGVAIGANALGALPILLGGGLGNIRRWLVPACRASSAGEPAVFAFAITEPGAGSDVEETNGARAFRPGVVARRDGGGFRLKGRKVFISGGDIARAVTVFAALEGEGIDSWTCFAVDARAEGFKVVRTERKMGQRASGAAELLFEDVFVPERDVVGGLRAGWPIARAALSFSRIPVGAIALGIARGALEAAIDFARKARLGGRALVEHQGVQLAIAEMMADTLAMRALVWRTAAPFTPRQAQASAAKSFCSDRAVHVCTRAMDLLGNHAPLHSNGVERRLRDARLTQIYEGTNEINRLAIIEDQLLELLPAPS